MSDEDRTTVPTTALDGWFRIDDVQDLAPFLVSIVSDDDHWMFVASNGGMTAGRGTPAMALFPYMTQDRLIDLAGTTGSLTWLRVDPDGPAPRLWRPLDPLATDHPRHLEKKLDGTRLRFTEQADGLTFQCTWGFSRRFGFVRQCALRNDRDAPVTVDLLDGVQNLAVPGVDDDFQNRFSVLVDAYKRAECLADTGLRLVYLSSVPTDRAEPSESLRCTVVWTAGLGETTRLLSTRQLDAFRDGEAVQPEAELRGQRAACLDATRLVLAPGETRRWATVAEVGQSTARVSFLQRFLQEHGDARRLSLIDAELARTSAGLRRLVASADGLQCSADRRRQARHFSNAMFNIMRGGVFLDGGRVPREAYADHLAHFDRALAERHAPWLATLPDPVEVPALVQAATTQGDPALERLTREFLPLTFSRRHGDPSRPWNRFAIEVRDRHGQPRLAWQGNWRDIFQNWEALVHAFPAFVDSTISRFVSASTADGYNPYRITHEGIDWEVVEPDQPWSNIGYWGDHQIIYLLRLLEASRRFHPDRLDALLDRPAFAYAHVPYRIAPYEEIVADPRSTVTYDHDAAARIEARVEARGADGKLLPGPDGSPLQVGLLEKLLVPLLAKLSNFVPGGGIWMNTQRPEWNDANNALVGFGVSVVTLAYCHRYVAFLRSWWQDHPDDGIVPVSREVIALLRAQAEVFDDPALRDDALLAPDALRTVLDRLGADASTWRQALYADGLSGETAPLSFGELRPFLDAVQAALAGSLRANRRPDGLFHSYNLLRFHDDGGVHIARLPEMLEGQVAVLSAGLLSSEEALDVARALRESALYRADQDSYILYPDRDLPRFLDKNRIDDALRDRSALLQALVADPDQEIVEVDVDGHLRFGGTLRNAAELREALAALPPEWRPLVAADGEALAAHLEDIFDHHAFTGRSGTFFAYEGLGSIYWHMVSKLVLALQEHALAAGARAEAGEDGPGEAGASEAAEGLARAFRAALEGLGMHKSPAHYGAFPTDAYSHTPKHAGAQQPGMTGQVKEDILVRWGELGVAVEAGRLRFRPRLLQADELCTAPTPFPWVDVAGHAQVLTVPAGGLAFTWCQVAVVYTVGPTAQVTVELPDGTRIPGTGTTLSADRSAAILARTGAVRAVHVQLPESWLRRDAEAPA